MKNYNMTEIEHGLHNQHLGGLGKRSNVGLLPDDYHEYRIGNLVECFLAHGLLELGTMAV